MVLLAVVLVALAVLFLLTALALAASDQLPHPYRTAVAIGAALVVGLALLLD
ncbi:MAG TPA: hypothetical protein VIA10_09000 [Gaiellaceae bacterium]